MAELGLMDIRITGKIEGQRLLRTGVRNDDPILLSVMQKAVASLDQDDHQDIRRRWSPSSVQTKEDYTLALWILGVSVLLLSFMVYRQITLRRYNVRIQEAFEEKEKANLALLEKTALLEKISITDPLTQVYNRLKINTILQHELQRVRRYGGNFSILLLDLDHFKDVNDTYGHPVGDQVLKTVVKVIQDGLRSTDSLGRWGGEEFMVICPETKLRNAVLVAENIRRQIASTLFDVVGQQNISVGVTMHQPGDTLEAMVMRADEALYQAKDAGRDQVASVPSL
jgi:polar amino acid transport system substrate-binding protein